MKTTAVPVVLVFSLLGAGCASNPQTAQAPSCELKTAPAAARDFRDKRYCEILLAQGVGPRLTGCVYNTICDNDCPPERWNALDGETLRKQYGASAIVMNGPRFFMMDISSSTTATDVQVNFDGVVMCPLAAIDLAPGSLLPGQREQPYTETTIGRRTEYVYFADRPVYLLVSPDHAAYILQSYSRIVDATLTAAQLPQLGGKLDLPAGWRYLTRVPKSSLTVRSHEGTAHVLQDNLQNTYQRLGNEEQTLLGE